MEGLNGQQGGWALESRGRGGGGGQKTVIAKMVGLEKGRMQKR